MFLDAKIGLLLFITHFLASITVGLIFKNYMKSSKTSNIIPQVSIKSKTYENINLQNLGKHMGNAIQNSISTLFMILGYMVFFSVFSNILSNVGIKTFFCNIIKIFLNILNISFDLSNGIFLGFLEITNGLNTISLLSHIDFIEKLPIAAFILGFGGFSVHMQVASILSDSNISLKPYLIGKLLQASFAAIYTYFLMKFTNFFSWEVVESFNYSNSNINVVSESSNLIMLLTLLISLSIIVQIIKIIKKTLKNEI